MNRQGRPNVPRRGAIAVVPVVVALLLGSCSPSDGPSTGSQTNWYRLCTDDTECGELDCICGTCTEACDDSCNALPDAICVAPQETASIALCGEDSSEPSICLGSCDLVACPMGAYCSDGICLPRLEDAGLLRVDLNQEYQELRGFGCSLAYGEDSMVTHPQKEELFDAMFLDSGLDVIRLRDRFEVGNEDDLSRTAEIIDAARARMSQDPLVLLTAGSPPAELKQNGMRFCSGNPDSCTLVRDAEDQFDYAGFAAHWRGSLEAYAAVSILPDYLSIQNNPDWVPPESEPNEACRFLPREGSTMVTTDEGTITVEYPGYQEALEAVEQQLEGLEFSVPLLLGPETTKLSTVADYEENIASGRLAALACHLYEADALSTDEDEFSAVSDLAEEHDLPVFVTEMSSDGLETALLVHRAVTEANAAMYLQNDFVTAADSLGDNPGALIQLTTDSFEVQEPYLALAHFARHTHPGWIRVAVELEGETDGGDDVLASAFSSPQRDELTLVLINPTTASEEVQIALDAPFSQSEVSVTTFGASEQGEGLGAIPPGRLVEVPPRSIVTIAFRN